jgi:hypothetical protein
LKAYIKHSNEYVHGWNELLPKEEQAGEAKYTSFAMPDWNLTAISKKDLNRWLKARQKAEKRPSINFFGDSSNNTADYLNPNHPRYSPKLAATVIAWQSVTDTKGKTPKQALEKWLREHAAEYGLTDNEGKIIELAIKECAKTANWKPDGGAPKTP